jgi:hypothetical protein
MTQRRATTSSVLARGVAYVLWLLATLALVEFVVWRNVEKQKGVGLLGQPKLVEIGAGDVGESLENADSPGEQVETIVLGDSVARQIFRAGAEPSVRRRYVTSNYAVGMPGQCYMLQAALGRCQHVRDVYLLCYPGTPMNDLRSPLTRDYLNGFFHSPVQVAEVWCVQKDVGLSASHVGRMLWPGMMAVNSAMQVAGPARFREATGPHFIAAGAFRQPPSENEPLLEFASDLIGRPPPHVDVVADGATVVAPSRASAHFIRRMRELCEIRGVRFHLLALPVAAGKRFTDPNHVFDADFESLPDEQFADGTHFEPERVEAVRRAFVHRHGLDPEMAEAKTSPKR